MAVGMSRLPLLFMLIAILFAAVGSAKSTAPAPVVDCSSLVLEMADCLSYVTEGGTAKKPEGTCCSGLKTVLKTDAECLCEAFRNSAQLGVTLNMTKALALPSACHVSAPSVSNCGLSVGTGAAPGLSPLLAPTSPVTHTPTTGGGGISANDVSPVSTPTSSLPGSSGSFALTSISAVLSTLLLAVVSFALF